MCRDGFVDHERAARFQEFEHLAPRDKLGLFQVRVPETPEPDLFVLADLGSHILLEPRMQRIAPTSNEAFSPPFQPTLHGPSNSGATSLMAGMQHACDYRHRTWLFHLQMWEVGLSQVLISRDELVGGFNHNGSGSNSVTVPD